MTDNDITRLIAEKVMGWEPEDCLMQDDGSVYKCCGNNGYYFMPLSDDADTEQVVYKMANDGWWVTIETKITPQSNILGERRIGQETTATFLNYGPGISYRQVDEWESRAICIAALRAVGVEVE